MAYRAAVAKAVEDTKNNVDHSERTYTLVVDYGQNMELPIFNKEQPGCAYYYSPLSVYNLGAVNHAHVYEDGRVDAHLHAHVYHEGVAKKGSNNVGSLLVKTLKDEEMIREGQVRRTKSVVFMLMALSYSFLDWG